MSSTKKSHNHRPSNKQIPDLLAHSSLLRAEDVIKEPGPKFPHNTLVRRGTISPALDLLSDTRAAHSLGKRERVDVDGVVVDDLAHGTGGDDSGTGDGVDLGLHGWGGGGCGLVVRVEVGKDRDLGAGSGDGHFHVGH